MTISDDRLAEQEEILAEVARLWRKSPDWRFGQFVLNKSRDGSGSVDEGLAWNRADGDWLRLLEMEK